MRINAQTHALTRPAQLSTNLQVLPQETRDASLLHRHSAARWSDCQFASAVHKNNVCTTRRRRATSQAAHSASIEARVAISKSTNTTKHSQIRKRHQTPPNNTLQQPLQIGPSNEPSSYTHTHTRTTRQRKQQAKHHWSANLATSSLASSRQQSARRAAAARRAVSKSNRTGVGRARDRAQRALIATRTKHTKQQQRMPTNQ